MIELLTQVFFEVIVKGTLLIPGTFTRWLFLFRKKSFETLLPEYTSYAVGMIFIGALGIIIKAIILN